VEEIRLVEVDFQFLLVSHFVFYYSGNDFFLFLKDFIKKVMTFLIVGKFEVKIDRVLILKMTLSDQ
jgi:hypothetical protein